jgi:hypothetical protein
MEIDWSDKAKMDIHSFERKLQGFFLAHLDKLSKMPPRRHLRHGLPFFVENVTSQARLAYLEDGNTIRIVRCFAAHKEYQRWYQSYR